MIGTNGTKQPRFISLRAVLVRLMSVAILLGLVHWGIAQTAPTRVIVADVFVFGNRSIPTAKVMQYIYTKPGSIYSYASAQDDVTRLAASRLFKSIRPVRT